MIFIIGDIVRLSDGTYEQIIGFNEEGPKTRYEISGGKLLDDGLFSISSAPYTAHIIGHASPRYDRTKESGDVAVTLYVL